MTDDRAARHLILVGSRGAGKTTVGRLLAVRLGRPFADADDLVEQAAGRSIREIFAAEGEAGFRDRESAALEELCAGPVGVIATGGGAVLRPGNRELLKARGVVVWLIAPPEVAWARISADVTTGTRRPNLTPAGGLDEVRSLAAAREPLYREVADLVVPCDAVSPDWAVDVILAAWASLTGANPG